MNGKDIQQTGLGFWETIPAFFRAKGKTRRNPNLYAALPKI
jgi:hypothetical protein